MPGRTLPYPAEPHSTAADRSCFHEPLAPAPKLAAPSLGLSRRTRLNRAVHLFASTIGRLAAASLAEPSLGGPGRSLQCLALPHT